MPIGWIASVLWLMRECGEEVLCDDEGCGRSLDFPSAAVLIQFCVLLVKSLVSRFPSKCPHRFGKSQISNNLNQGEGEGDEVH